MHYAQWPLSVAEVAEADAEVEALFRASFRAPPPDFPRHFVAVHQVNGGKRLAAYMHFTVAEDDVYLLGGLCVRHATYRAMDPGTRSELARQGSLSRWFLHRAIEALGPKRAVFAYTGDTRSRRDALAIGMVEAGQYLFVQWHDEPEAGREALVQRIDALGPF